MPTTTAPAAAADLPTLCGCGCGTPVARRYAPGHDARHKAALVATLQSDWRSAWVAADALADLGWDGFADPADLRAVPYRNGQGRALQVAAEVGRWQVDHLGSHHCDRRCKRLTAHARLAGAVNPITRLAADRYVTLVDNSHSLTLQLVDSWDLCTECTTDYDRSAYCEYRQVTRAAIDPVAEPRNWKRTPVLAWDVEMEDGSVVHMVRNNADSKPRVFTPDTPTQWAAPNPTTRVA